MHGQRMKPPGAFRKRPPTRAPPVVEQPTAVRSRLVVLQAVDGWWCQLVSAGVSCCFTKANKWLLGGRMASKQTTLAIR